MYSPGKAFVVYEMRRHVCVVSFQGNTTAKVASHLANGTVTCDNALFKVSFLEDKSLMNPAVERTLRDWVAGAAMVCVLCATSF
jgi:hypothetical protein